MSSLSRYPGAKPFETEEGTIFFGRDEDITNLRRKMRLAPLTVLYGKSGTGKSSLLNAGLFPSLAEEDQYDFLRIRFTAWQNDKNGSLPLETTRQRLKMHASGNILGQLLPTEESLWKQSKEHFVANEGERGLLLVFDQFEELFTYPEEAVLAFRRELAEVLYTAAPQRYWDELEALYKEEGQLPMERSVLQLIQMQPNVKVIFAIRSDRMHLLEKLSDHLPLVLKNLQELNPLTASTATSAISEPAVLKGDFTCPRFTYQPTALDSILRFLSDDGMADIELTQLQIICRHLEESIIATQAFEIVDDDVQDLESIIENYYDERLSLIGDKVQHYAARRLIEEGLVFEEEERRLSIYEGQALKSFGLKPATLRTLVDAHLLRAEASLRGGYTYELSHDTLVRPILKAKAIRLTREATAAKEEERRVREMELATERKKRRRAYAIAIGMALLALIAVASTIWALRQKTALQQANVAVVREAYAVKWALAQNLKVQGQLMAAQDTLRQAANFIAPTDATEIDRLRDTLDLWQEIQTSLSSIENLRAKGALGEAASILATIRSQSWDRHLQAIEDELTVERGKRYRDLKRQAETQLYAGERAAAVTTYQEMLLLDWKNEEVNRLLEDLR